MSALVKNIMEKMVEDKLDQMLPQLNCCNCDRCRTDILCYALNRLKPKYVSTEQGELLSRVDSISITYEASIMTEIANAVEIVKKNPHHR
ncbi:MAG: late competence development ComFB family protein [Lachnospiraceae bacterium]|jgi:competence protein ComFB|nr:late competence development ComFB family protein [Lachnospiraceae bacterium]